MFFIVARAAAVGSAAYILAGRVVRPHAAIHKRPVLPDHGPAAAVLPGLDPNHLMIWSDK